MGDTQIRLRNVVPRRVSGDKSRLTIVFNASVTSHLRAQPEMVAHDTLMSWSPSRAVLASMKTRRSPETSHANAVPR